MDRHEIPILEKQLASDRLENKCQLSPKPKLCYKDYRSIAKKIEPLSTKMILNLKTYIYNKADFSIIRDKYEIIKELKESTFSNVYYSKNLRNGKPVSIKKIKDDKTFFDQSLNEIYVLDYLKKCGPPNKYNFLDLQEAFYYNVI